jgi:hypothetical protein
MERYRRTASRRLLCLAIPHFVSRSTVEGESNEIPGQGHLIAVCRLHLKHFGWPISIVTGESAINIPEIGQCRKI